MDERAPTGRDNSRRDHLKMCAVLGLAVMISYANSLRGDFQFSDYNVIVSNPVAHSFQAWFQNALHGGIRPLLKLSYALNWVIGPEAFGFHVFNLAVHGANVVLVYHLCRHLCSAWGQVPAGLSFENPALLGALLFAVHPVQTEAVTYISGRSSSLMALFYLASLLSYIHGLANRKRIWQLVVSPVFFVLAVAVKEVAVSLPFALLLWDRVARRRSWKEALSGQAAHWVLLLGVMMVILTNRRYLELLLFSSTLRNMFDSLLSQINGMMYLLSRLLVINGMNIDPDIKAVSSLDPATSVNLLLLSAVALLFVWKRQTRPWLAFGLAWFIVVLFPSNSVIPRLDVVNERHLYLANLGFCVAAGMEFTSLCRRFMSDRRILHALAALTITVLASFTVIRNNDYRSEVALWESTVRLSPDKSRGYNNLGYAYETAGRHGDAVAAFRKSLELQPGNATARRNLEKLGVSTQNNGDGTNNRGADS